MAWSDVKFLATGDSYFTELLRRIQGAETSVLLEFYIFRMDPLGREILEALCACRDRGVKVFLRLDGVGSLNDLGGIESFCGERELELEIFHPLPFTKPGSYFPAGFAKADTFLTRWALINRRTHRKLVIIDEKIAFTGGMNIQREQSERFSGREAWHDLSVRVEGPGVGELVQAFWFRPFREFTYEHCLLNYSWRLRQGRNNFVSRSINQARERVWVISPYFAPPPNMLFQLRVAAKRGIDIRLIMGKKSDVFVSRLAAMGLYRKLLSWGIKVYEYEPSLLHRKLWVIDDISLVGSTNFNHRSFFHDLEIDVILRQPERVDEAKRLFLSDQEQSTRINEDFLQHLGWGSRLLSWVAGWFTYWL